MVAMKRSLYHTRFHHLRQFLAIVSHCLCLLLMASLLLADTDVPRMAAHKAPLTQDQYIRGKEQVLEATLRTAQLRNQAHSLLSQFHDEVNHWGNAHIYHDSYDGRNYLLDSGYTQQGMGTLLDAMVAGAYTDKAFQTMIDKTENLLFNLRMLEADYRDQMPFDAVHATDLQLLQHYQLQKKQVVVISLVEQTVRVYQGSKLVQAFLVTSGRPEHPSLPGVWPTANRFSPTIFTSPFPEGSSFWFPPTTINYAILYHLGGYFIHDSWWRSVYGPGTQFPHPDVSENSAFSNSGSHGCINLPEQAAGWLYQHTNWDTTILVY